MHAFAPQAVSAADIIANLQGENEMPMAIYVDTRQNPSLESYGIPTLVNALNMIDPSVQGENQRWLFATRNYLYNMPYPYEYLYILTTDDDYEANVNLYDAMIRYFSTYQYYASPRLRHTLFLGDMRQQFEDSYNTAYFAFPDGWIEYIADDGIVTVVPEGFDPNDPDAPTIRLYPVKYLNEDSVGISRQSFALIAEAYNLSDEAQATLSNRFFPNDNVIFCEQHAVDPVMYENDGRQGFISGVSRYYIEASAPLADFEIYADVLQLVPATLTDPTLTCG